jgi:PHD-finger
VVVDQLFIPIKMSPPAAPAAPRVRPPRVRIRNRLDRRNRKAAPTATTTSPKTATAAAPKSKAPSHRSRGVVGQTRYSAAQLASLIPRREHYERLAPGVLSHGLGGPEEDVSGKIQQLRTLLETAQQLHPHLCVPKMKVVTCRETNKSKDSEDEASTTTASSQPDKEEESTESESEQGEDSGEESSNEQNESSDEQETSKEKEPKQLVTMVHHFQRRDRRGRKSYAQHGVDFYAYLLEQLLEQQAQSDTGLLAKTSPSGAESSANIQDDGASKKSVETNVPTAQREADKSSVPVKTAVSSDLPQARNSIESASTPSRRPGTFADPPTGSGRRSGRLSNTGPSFAAALPKDELNSSSHTSATSDGSIQENVLDDGDLFDYLKDPHCVVSLRPIDLAKQSGDEKKKPASRSHQPDGTKPKGKAQEDEETDTEGADNEDEWWPCLSCDRRFYVAYIRPLEFVDMAREKAQAAKGQQDASKNKSSSTAATPLPQEFFTCPYCVMEANEPKTSPLRRLAAKGVRLMARMRNRRMRDMRRARQSQQPPESAGPVDDPGIDPEPLTTASDNVESAEKKPAALTVPNVAPTGEISSTEVAAANEGSTEKARRTCRALEALKSVHQMYATQRKRKRHDGDQEAEEDEAVSVGETEPEQDKFYSIFNLPAELPQSKRQRRPPATYVPQTESSRKRLSEDSASGNKGNLDPTKDVDDAPPAPTLDAAKPTTIVGSTPADPSALESTKRGRKTACPFCGDNPQISLCFLCACRVCFGKHSIDRLLLCDYCDDEYHTFCLKPPLAKLPHLDSPWYCPTCAASLSSSKSSKKRVRSTSATPSTTAPQSEESRVSRDSSPKPTKATSDPLAPKRGPGRPSRAEMLARGVIPASQTRKRSGEKNRGPGRPRKVPLPDDSVPRRKPGRPIKNKGNDLPKRKPGRPFKNPRPTDVGGIGGADGKDTVSCSQGDVGRGDTPAPSALVSRSGRTLKRNSFHDEAEGGETLRRSSSSETRKSSTKLDRRSTSSDSIVAESKARSKSHALSNNEAMSQAFEVEAGVSSTDDESATFSLLARETLPMNECPSPPAATREANATGSASSGIQAAVLSSSDTLAGMPLPETALMTTAPRYVGGDTGNSSQQVGAVEEASAAPGSRLKQEHDEGKASEARHASAAAAGGYANAAQAQAPSAQEGFGDESEAPTKVPRRKPGARECMQMSRRFGVHPIPPRYMSIMLDYCQRGKVEHLIRMRERLDDHSRFLEAQLAGLEALVLEHGESDVIVPAVPASSASDPGGDDAGCSSS